MTRDHLQTLLDGFKRDNRLFYNEMLDPKLAQNMCSAISTAFVAWCLQNGESLDDVETIVCEHALVDFPNHSWDHRVHFENFWHMIARAGQWYVDWSIRQLTVDAPVPMIYTTEELRAIWKDITTQVAYEEEEQRVQQKLRDLGLLDDD